MLDLLNQLLLLFLHLSLVNEGNKIELKLSTYYLLVSYPSGLIMLDVITQSKDAIQVNKSKLMIRWESGSLWRLGWFQEIKAFSQEVGEVDDEDADDDDDEQVDDDDCKVGEDGDEKK